MRCSGATFNSQIEEIALRSTLLRTVMPGCFDGGLNLAGSQTIQWAMASQTVETSKKENDRFPFAFKSEFSQAVSNSEHHASMFSRKLPDRINPLAGLISDADDLPVSPPPINDRGVSQSHQVKHFNFAYATPTCRQ